MNRVHATINWLALWKHRWLILLFLSNLRHASLYQTRVIVRMLRGSEDFATKLHFALRDVVDPGVD